MQNKRAFARTCLYRVAPLLVRRLIETLLYEERLSNIGINDRMNNVDR